MTHHTDMAPPAVGGSTEDGGHAADDDTTHASRSVKRRLPIGAEVQPAEDGGGVHFRVWAPDRKLIAVVIDGQATPLTRETHEGDTGYFSGLIGSAAAGTLYKFKLEDNDYLFPDMASRFQPEGPHGPSRVVDHTSFAWTDADWRGCRLEGQVMYEMHIGTFTPEGTWRAAMAQLEALRDLGITVLEIMPIGEFPGKFGWGYDGVDWFAPTRLYGEPDDLRAFIDRAHVLGLGVILDVVYNHIGPDGNYSREFAETHISDRYENEWGDPLNFDGPGAHGMRELVLANVQYWVEEYHFDGYRLDATQQIFDASEDHILAALSRVTRKAANGRDTLIVGENESQHAQLMRPADRGGYGLDALWNDDFHHSAVVALTGRAEAYYSDYRGTPQEFLSCAKWGFIFQGQYYPWQTNGRGLPALDCRPAQFITFIENHDQVANTADGSRLRTRTSAGRYRAMTGLLLLMPGTPLLFQGQEYGSTKPFLFFADHAGQLGQDVGKGRAEFLAQFPSVGDPAAQARLCDPSDPDTFKRSTLDHAEREHPENAAIVALHRDLLKLRRDTPAFRAQAPRGLDGAILSGSQGGDVLLLRYFHEAGDRLVLLNLGRDQRLDAGSDPLIAAPEGLDWAIEWSSEDPTYSGGGTPPLELDQWPGTWTMPGESLIVFAPVAGRIDRSLGPRKKKTHGK
jgi:maltooligosyltrehalose trehalohydrolase